MKILFVAPWYPANPIRFLADTLVDMGHEVFRVGPTYNQHGGIDWGKHEVGADLEIPQELPLWNLPYFLEICARTIRSPDIAIFSEENYRTAIVPIAHKLPCALISFDGWAKNFERRHLYQTKINYTSRPFGVRAEPRKEPDPHWKYFASACYPKVHQFLNIPRDLDFVLNASMYGGRQNICDFLQSRGLSVRSGYTKTEEYVMNANRALATYVNANGQAEVKWRYMEQAAMGCVNICDSTVLYEWIGAKPYEHYFPVARVFQKELNEEWPEPYMIYECVQVLKQSPSLVDHIRQNALKLALEKHTYLHRAEMILKDLGDL